MKIHHPYHLYLENHVYFFTAHTYNNLLVLKDKKRKEELKQRLKDINLRKQGEIIAWVILDNHYHFLMSSKNGNDIKTIFQNIHGSTSFKWNSEDKKRGRKVWQNY